MVHPARRGPVTKARATAYARAVNLQPADLPGMRIGSPEREAKTPSAKDRALVRCAGGVNPDLRIIDRSSPTFAGIVGEEHEEIRSDVEVMPSARLARLHNAAQLSRRGLSCLRRVIGRTFAMEAGPRVHFGPVAISRLPAWRESREPSFRVQFKIPILGVPPQVAARNPHLYVDAIGFVHGAAEVTLTAISFPQPLPEEVEKRLKALLHNRAVTHVL